MPPKSAPARARYDLDSLTAVALSVFREKGYDATSMEDLASAARLSKAAFYHHISAKEDLLARGLERALDALFAVFEEPLSVDGAAIDRLRHVVRRVVELEHELLPEVTVLLRARGNSTTERAALDRRRRFDRRVADLVRTAQSEGTLRPDLDANVASRLAIGMATSVTEWYRPGGRLSGRDLADHVVTLVFGGLATRTTAGKTTKVAKARL